MWRTGKGSDCSQIIFKRTVLLCLSAKAARTRGWDRRPVLSARKIWQECDRAEQGGLRGQQGAGAV